MSSSTANGSVSNSGTYIRSQYNGLNPPGPGGGAASHNTSLLSDRLDHHMDISLASPDDLPVPPGYDPSLTDGPPSTIGDPGTTYTYTTFSFCLDIMPKTIINTPEFWHHFFIPFTLLELESIDPFDIL